MSGDSGSKKKSSTEKPTDAVPAYLGGGVQSMFPQALPGQLNALAEQLSMGHGAPVSQNLSLLDALYSPMSVPMVEAPKPAAPTSKPGTSKPAVSTSGGSLMDNWRERQKSRQR